MDYFPSCNADCAIREHGHGVCLLHVTERPRNTARGVIPPICNRPPGQAMPTAATTTLVWAALKDDEAMIARLCTMSEKARAQAQALTARLPEDAQVRWTHENWRLSG